MTTVAPLMPCGMSHFERIKEHLNQAGVAWRHTCFLKAVVSF